MRSVARVSFTLALVALACADPESTEPPGARNPLPLEDGAGPIDALSRRYGRLRQRMRDRGYGDEIGVARWFLLEDQGRSLPMDLDTGRCTTLVALAGGSIRDLRMRAYDGDGEEVATDVVDGDGALAHVCPRSAGGVPMLPYYVVLDAPSGSGSVILAAYASELGGGQGFDGLFDGVLAPQVPFQSVTERLARSRSALRARGLLPVGEPAVDSVAEGDGLRVAVPMDPDRCYVVVARGGEGLSDIDLMLFDEQGTEVARDLESDPEPSLEVCPEAGGQYVAEASAYEGAGAIGVIVLAGPRPAERPEEDVLAPQEPLPPGARPPGESDPVAALVTVAGTLTARGYGQPSIVVGDGYIAPGEVRSHEVLVGAGCAIIIGTARNDTDLDLYLTDEPGTVLDRDTGIHPLARVRACLGEPTVLRVTVKSYGRRSAYALALLSAPEGLEDIEALRLDEAMAALRERGYTAVDTLRQVIDTGERFERTLTVRPGTCLAIAAAGDASVEDLDVFLRDAAGNLVASASGPEPYAAVSRCAEMNEPIRVEVVMYRGAGSVQITRLEGSP